eukprot:gene18824-biopygen18997
MDCELLKDPEAGRHTIIFRANTEFTKYLPCPQGGLEGRHGESSPSPSRDHEFKKAEAGGRGGEEEGAEAETGGRRRSLCSPPPHDT